MALYAMGGALFMIMRAVFDGRVPKNAELHHAEGILRMLGITPDEAAEVARLPLPKPVAASAT